MMMGHYYEEPEKYSYFKKRKFEQYKVKMQRLLKGIDDLSLKPTDKVKLRGRLLEQLNISLL